MTELFDHERKVLVAELEAIYETTSTPGWEILCKTLDKKIDAIKEELSSPTLEANEYLLRIAQGRILAYRDLLSCQNQTRWALNDLTQVQED